MKLSDLIFEVSQNCRRLGKQPKVRELPRGVSPIRWENLYLRTSAEGLGLSVCLRLLSFNTAWKRVPFWSPSIVTLSIFLSLNTRTRNCLIRRNLSVDSDLVRKSGSFGAVTTTATLEALSASNLQRSAFQGLVVLLPSDIFEGADIQGSYLTTKISNIPHASPAVELGRLKVFGES